MNNHPLATNAVRRARATAFEAFTLFRDTNVPDVGDVIQNASPGDSPVWVSWAITMTRQVEVPCVREAYRKATQRFGALGVPICGSGKPCFSAMGRFY